MIAEALASVVGDRSPLSNFWYNPIGRSASSGVIVTDENALAVSAFFACCRVLMEGVGSLPWFTYERLTGGGKDKANDHYLYNVLKNDPNPFQTSMQWREMMVAHMILRGVAYNEITPGPLGPVGALTPLNPDRMKVIPLGNGRVRYEYRTKDGVTRNLSHDQVWPVFGLMIGDEPVSLLTYARQTLGLSIAEQDREGAFYRTGMSAKFYLSTTKRLGPEGRKNFREGWKDVHGGADQHFEFPLLEDDMSLTELGMNNADAQMFESRVLTGLDVARFFRMQPHKIQMLENATFSNIEQQAIEHVVDTLRPWLVRFEQASRQLFIEPDDFFAEFLVDGLLRGDVKSRTFALAQQFINGSINQDEWRSIENRNPLPNGEGQKFYRPANLVEVGKEPEPGPVPGGVGGPQPAAPPQAVDLSPLIEDAAERIVSAEVRALVARAGKAAEDRGKFNTWVAAWYEKHTAYVVKTLEPITGTGFAERWALEYCMGDSAVLQVADPVSVIEEWKTMKAAVVAKQIKEALSCQTAQPSGNE